MSIVITGSLAFDHIMVFKDEFKNHILPDKVHILNVSFQVDDLSKEFGGTAGNIAYNMQMLGITSEIVAAVGSDFDEYRQRIIDWGLVTSGIMELDDAMTAQAFITTDLKDNQITAFHGGAMYRAHEQSLSRIKERPELVLVAADGIEAMVEHSKYCQTNNWKFWFDPGQGISALTGDQLLHCIRKAEGLIVNDYEWQLFQDKTKCDLNTVLQDIPYVLVTLGSEGVEVLSRKSRTLVPAVPNLKVIDPTGAGDAFRAGLLYGLQCSLGIIESCKYACAVASFAVECTGTQNHVFNLNQVKERVAYVEG